jgi:hypothetical protein
MINQKRRPFRSRPHKNNYRGRGGSSRPNNNGHYQNNNGNNNFTRNGSMTNPFNVEKTIQKFQQLAKDAQSTGDLVLVENYLQHADHYSRRLSELNMNKTTLTQVKEVEKEENSEATINNNTTSVDNSKNLSEKKD